jgi:hypothetical protein
MRAAVSRSCLALLLTLTACRASAPPGSPYNYSRAEDIVHAMRDRYYGRWHQNLVGVQHNYDRPADGDTARSIWLVAVAPPGRVRIDYDPRERGNGVLILGDTQYVMSGGRPSEITRSIDPLLLLQHDIYFLDAAATLARLRDLRVNLDLAHADVWQGRPMLVVGAPAGDARSRQLWIDRELMLLVRWIEPWGRDGAITTETRLLNYERMGGAWVARRVEHYEGDRMVLRQEVRQIRANLALDSLLFRPDDWTRARHWYQTPVLRQP